MTIVQKIGATGPLYTSNAAMLAVNGKLGYRPEPGVYNLTGRMHIETLPL